MSGFTQHFHTAPDGIRTAFRHYEPDQPSGALPVVCLHGLTRNSKDFEEVAPRIAASGRRVIAVDVRGRGLSDRGTPPESYSPQVYVEDLFGLLDQEGIERFVAVGTSMGGIMTMIAAAMRPDMVAGAVLNDIGPELDPAGLNRIAGYVGRAKGPMDSWQEAAAAVRAVNGEAFPDETGEAFWLAFARRTCREMPDGRVELDYDPAIAAPFREPEGAAPPDMWPLFDALSPVPVLGIRGAISDLLSPEVFQAMGKRHPRFTGVEVPRVGHAPLLTETHARDAIDAFLRDTD
ncbi:alpha/beta hydrolase fold protein [Glycocaulis alkaliphilus]|uniref:Alpha/beta hydrolase fold protein n=1 Tax=Glycocaulis alkaliphilus TaxID=1434191 RepID=A0A3T0EAW3_9PROT|nr:alpha/beta hydrolase [Glycocaulis alkaliphilus]AZU04420.1 alpha/beta hydrolase fold protein [Glycocaulis alkaliphilus]GGB78246.1 alpha/beta hydrolase [Glycocaulis alkaliphilus]